MNYVKKMCVLRQVKQGFSGDGKTLSGLVKIEQYGKNLAVEVSVINFAPLASGEYYCMISDGKGKTEMLSLRGKSLFNILSDVDISDGFCAVICHVKTDFVPIAYGVNGNGYYDWRAIVNSTLPPVFPTGPDATEKDNVPTMAALNNELYDDDTVATTNYYEENEDEREQFKETENHARTKSAAAQPNAEEGTNAAENGDAPRVLHPFQTHSDGYYLSIKAELDELFSKHPKDDTLKDAFSCSEWVRVRGTVDNPQYLVGVLYDDGRAKYILYALAAQDRNNPPEEIKEVCTFVPLSYFEENTGFFIIFQSASTGECIRPQQV